MNNILNQCTKILESKGIDITSEIDFLVNSDVKTLTFESIIISYMQASEESQQFFLEALKKVVATDEAGIEKFFEGMGQLLLMSHLSEVFDS
jgi:hypothetical protein